MSTPAQRAAAVHESGHALACVVHGVPMAYLSLSDAGGYCACDDTGYPLAVRLLVTASGPIGQLTLCPRSWKRTAWGDGPGSDAWLLAQLLDEAGVWGFRRERMQQEVISAARLLVQEWREWVWDLAARLLVEGRVDGHSCR